MWLDKVSNKNSHKEEVLGAGVASQSRGVSPIIQAPNHRGSFSTRQSQFPHFPSTIIGLKVRFPTSLASLTISGYKLLYIHFYIWCPKPLMCIVPVILSLHLGPVCVVISFIVKCQWSG